MQRPEKRVLSFSNRVSQYELNAEAKNFKPQRRTILLNSFHAGFFPLLTTA